MTGYESDEELTLSSSTLAALQEFYAERQSREEEFSKLQARVEILHAAGTSGQKLSMDLFAEDWNESQFWYSEETARLLATELLEGVTEDMTVAVVSAPSVFVAIKNILNEAPPEQPRPKLVLLEHDNRFGIFPEFVFYDFAQPLKLPDHLKGTCDRFIIDPPYLSEDCQTKTALTVRWLARSATTAAAAGGNQPSHPRLILCTGERMRTLALRLYKSFGLRTTDYEPKHARGLSNEFYSYANFESKDGAWGWRQEEEEEQGKGEGKGQL
ncbi:hypothetical protein VTJ83DRAFT_2963 [Remersonia thermophila]|uniref:Protein-lysine N-methyltransferase EFM5 n=1 Tax=Remersonia thermophila TaxID=72144 RepID=A0ABR4DCP3_9PEZI